MNAIIHFILAIIVPMCELEFSLVVWVEVGVERSSRISNTLTTNIHAQYIRGNVLALVLVQLIFLFRRCEIRAR